MCRDGAPGDRKGSLFVSGWARPHGAVADSVVQKLGLEWNDALLAPSWNGRKMEQVYPWGTIRIPTTEVNVATMKQLDADQKAIIKYITSVMLPHFDYENMA